MKFFVTVLLSFLIIALSHSGFSQKSCSDAVVGKWYTPAKDAIVSIFKKDNKFFGKLTWMKNPLNEDGTPKLDVNNPDKKKRLRKLIGLIFIRNFRYKGENKWEEGTVYNIEDGKTYKAKMKLEEDNLELRGYIGIPLLGKTTVFSKVKV